MKCLFLLGALLQSALGTDNENRRRLAPNASIISEMNQQLDDGISHPRFTISALLNGDSNLFTDEDDTEAFEIDVVLTNPSVSERTSFSIDGFSRLVEDPVKILVADHINDHTNDFAILVVDEKKGIVSGMVQKNSKFVKLDQRRDGPTVATEIIFDPDEEWECLFDEHDSNHEHIHEEGQFGNAFELLSSRFGHGRNLRRNRYLYATDTFPNAWSYQVDLFIEVDEEFVQNHDTDTVNMPESINYINALVSAVSAIYEREIDTHLNVLHVSKTNIYDGAPDATVALDIMRDTYSASTWHYTDPATGENPDLHHALLFRTPRAGYASVGGVCDSKVGYGVSAGMQGTIDKIDSGTLFWDIVVLAHELGHNFGSRHTHDANGYSPLVDDCGNGGCNSLVTGEAVSAGEASLMSYCNKCTGGITNMGPSFGGYWFEDNRGDVNNWNNNDASVPFGREPKRVPKVLYDYVSSRGTCVDPYLTADIQTCSQNADCHDGNSCTVDTCNGDQCSNQMQGNCCGNFICEAGESDCSDCGPFKLITPSCSTCVTPYGEMFDIQAVSDIILNSIDVKMRAATNTITLFTASGGYSDKARKPELWTQIYSGTFEVSSGTFTTVSINFDDIKLSAESIQAFYVASTAQLASLENNKDNPLASDDHLRLLNPTRGVTETQFGSAYSNIISWVGAMYYSIEAPPESPTTNVPTSQPSTIPPTKSPTISPSLAPSSKSPSISPTTDTPTSHPSTTQPTKSLTASPSRAPSSKSPSINPTNASTSSNPSKFPSASPNLSPSKSPNTSDSPSKIPSKKPSTEPTGVLSQQPTTSQPSKPLNTPGPSQSPSFSPSSLKPTKEPTGTPSFKPTILTLSPSKAQVTNEPTPEPSRRPTRTPSRKPTNKPSVRPTVSPTMMPAVISQTLIYSVSLCYQGTCGDFSDTEEFENIIKTYIPCNPKKCDVTIIAQSDQCSPCQSPSSRQLRFLKDSTQSSAITFEIKSKTGPLNEVVVMSNLNSNIENANDALGDDDSKFRIGGEFTVSTAAPSQSPSTTKPTKTNVEKPVKRPTMKPTRRPTKRPSRKPIPSISGGKSSKGMQSPSTMKPTKTNLEKPVKRPTLKPTRRPTKRPSRKPIPGISGGKSSKGMQPEKPGKGSSKSGKAAQPSSKSNKLYQQSLLKNQKDKQKKTDDNSKPTKREKKQLAKQANSNPSQLTKKEKKNNSISVSLTKQEKKELARAQSQRSVKKNIFGGSEPFTKREKKAQMKKSGTI